MSALRNLFLQGHWQMQWCVRIGGTALILLVILGARAYKAWAAGPPVDYLAQRKIKYRRENLALQRLVTDNVALGIWTRQKAEQYFLDERIGLEGRYINDCVRKGVRISRYYDTVREHMLFRARLTKRYRFLKQSGQWTIAAQYANQPFRSPFASATGSIVEGTPPAQGPVVRKNISVVHRARHRVLPQASNWRMHRGRPDDFLAETWVQKHLTAEAAKDVEFIR